MVNENRSQKNCHSKIFMLNFLCTNSDSLTLTGSEEFLVSLLRSLTDNVEIHSIGGTLLKARSNFANISKKLSSIISSSSFSLSSGFNKFIISLSSYLILLNFSW